MCENSEDRPLERMNPFVDDTDNTPYGDICATYNASFAASGETENDRDNNSPRFETAILDDYFNEPLIHVDSNSSVEELEDAIFRLKHMVLASTNDADERRQRLLDRLIELRRILHTIKESANPCHDATVNAADESAPLNQTYAHTPSTRRVRSSSQLSLPIRVRSPEPRSSIRSHSPTQSIGGHQFKLTLSFRFLGQSCEHCRKVIRDPSRRIFACSHCPVVCHSQLCLRGLTRRCPCSLISSDWYFSLKPPSSNKTKLYPEHGNTLPQPALFRHLEVYRLCYLGANLTDQCWSCFECRKPLRPAPNSTVSAEPSVMTPFVQETSSVMENTADLLMRQAARTEVNPNIVLKCVTPQLQSQVDSLWDQSTQILSQHPKITVPMDNASPHLQWAYTDAQTDLGPIQTWADAMVLESVHRIPRKSTLSASPSPSISHLRPPLVLNGEIVKPLASTSAGSVCPANNALEQLDQARLCYYTGQFYCHQCHWGDSHMIPACVFTLGEYRPKPVCRSALLWLSYAWSRHLFRVPDPWYQHEPNARAVAALRIRLFRFKPYVDSCDQARALWLELNSKEPYWIFEQPYTFTMDLVNGVLNGTFAAKLENYIHSLDDHVQSCQNCDTRVPPQCPVCQKGPIRSYEALGTFCSQCHRSCHRSCLACPLPSSLDIDTAAMASSSCSDQLADTPGGDLQPANTTDTYLLEVLYPAMRTVCLSCSRSTK